MPSTLSPSAQTSVRRLLDGAARRILAEQLALGPTKMPAAAGEDRKAPDG
jgi:hypothetical protein